MTGFVTDKKLYTSLINFAIFHNKRLNLIVAKYELFKSNESQKNASNVSNSYRGMLVSFTKALC